MSTPRTILITGAAGFVGHHMVEHFLKNTNDTIIGMDSLTYAGTWDRLRDVIIQEPQKGFIWETSAYDHERFTPMVFDFRNEAEPNLVKELSEVTHILHLGAESHVDNSITDPLRFVQSNVVGTVNMIQLAKQLPNLELFLYFSTDEVFGPAPFGDFKGYKEDAPHSPKNPYAGTKSAAEQMVTSFANTYELPCIITRQMNIFGERQHPEKFIPLCVNKALNGGEIQIHATPDKKKAGQRHYIHARNVADAHLFLLKEKPWLASGTVRDVPAYHIVGEIEMDNRELAVLIDQYVGHLGEIENIVCEGASFKMVDFHSSRKGHDLRYALDGGKMKGLGWSPKNTFHQSLKRVIEWTLKDVNRKWLG